MALLGGLKPSELPTGLRVRERQRGKRETGKSRAEGRGRGREKALIFCESLFV